MILQRLLILILMIFSLLVGAKCIDDSTKITDKIQLQVYTFSVSVENQKDNTILGNFRFTYDFTKKNGKISFKLVKPTNLKHLEFGFPLNISEGRNCSKLINKTIIKDREKVQMEDIKKNTKIVIDIKEEMLPNAIFDLLHTNNIQINPDTFAFNMTLGKDYECIGQCFIDLTNTEDFYLTSADSILVDFQEGTNIKPQHRFKIMARNVENINLQNRSLGFGLAFLFLGLSLLINFLIKDNII